MNNNQDNYRYVLLWWGDNAFDWEWKGWQLVKESEAYSEIEAFLESKTTEECDVIHARLMSEGWELAGTGSGLMRRIGTYRKLRSSD